MAKSGIKRVYPLPSINPDAWAKLEQARKQIKLAEEANAKSKEALPFEVSAEAYFFGK